MKPAAFAYRRAEHLDEAVDLLARHAGDARVLAGGQSLLPLLNRRLARPRLLVDIARIADLAQVGIGSTGITIGGAATQRAVERSPSIGRACPILPQALAWVGSVATKARGTVVGSVAFGDPLGELPTAMLALDASVEAVSARGARSIRIDDLYAAPFTTTLAPDELLASVQIPPLPERARTCYLEVARRRGIARATVGVAAVVVVADGRIRHLRLALAGCGATPLRVATVEAALVGAEPTAERIGSAVAAAVDELAPPSTIDADRETRKRLAATLLVRALRTTTAEEDA